jgi:hypothetical protein
MIALTDNQLALVMIAASALPPEKRKVFMERLATFKLSGRDNVAPAIEQLCKGWCRK